MKSLSLLKPALFLMLISVCCTLPLKAQQTKNVTLGSFTTVAVSSGIELIINQSGAENAKIVAKAEIIDEVLIQLQGRNLRISWKPNEGYRNQFKNKSAKVYLNYKSLNDISASSGSSISTENVLKTTQLELRASSGASINAKIACSNLELHTSSGASADISGSATNLDMSTSSGGSIDAGDLLSDYAKASASSGGSAKINVAKGLEASTSSGGSISYKGNASLHNVSSRSSVRHID
jgi:hypothetical protein